MSVKDLLKEIEYCRNEMVYLASQSSLSNENVIAVSTKLDDLLNKYDDITTKKQ
ncbi:Spo0E family sporulation regulatory protein-aspartic acid phosphatase [Cytobacillus sp. FJAT-54145]|uniref:Spo0E family sporulation regulatory protein-aspartic acid phosphatase n=1 Tax=Cytobacillus spartinae TaxID=3299023 RepID=A0ABW6KIY7_9BACI